VGYPLLDDRNIRREFFARLNIAEAGSWASELGLRVPSDRASEDYKWLGSVPMMREWLGSRLERRVRVEAYTICNAEYESTMDLPVPDMRRDRTAMLMARVNDLAVRAGTHWEALLSALIIAGETDLCYDGKSFFATDHVSGSSGTLTNDLTATEVPGAAVVDSTAPTAAELANVIVQMIQHMYTFKDDQGEPINQNARQFYVMVPTPFMANTITALSAQYLTNGVTNPVVANGFAIEALVNPRLTWTTKLAMFRRDGALKPFILQDEVPIETTYIGADSEEEFKNNRHLFGIHASRAVGYGLWQHAALVTLSDA